MIGQYIDTEFSWKVSEREKGPFLKQIKSLKYIIYDMLNKISLDYNYFVSQIIINC